MPFHRLIIPTGGPGLQHRAALAAAVTRARTGVTGAPAHVVDTAFLEVPPGSLHEADRPVEHGRMIGLIRRGRDEATLRRLVHALADAWSGTTGEPRDRIAIFLHEVPGHLVLEHGELLPEAWEDGGAAAPAPPDGPDATPAPDPRTDHGGRP